MPRGKEGTGTGGPLKRQESEKRWEKGASLGRAPKTKKEKPNVEDKRG